MRYFLYTIAVLFAMATAAGASGIDISPFTWNLPFEDECGFVEVPATVGKWTGFSIGFIVLSPCAIVSDLPGEPVGDLWGYWWFGSGALGTGGHYLLGTPFFLTKKALWDGPRTLTSTVGNSVRALLYPAHKWRKLYEEYRALIVPAATAGTRMTSA